MQGHLFGDNYRIICQHEKFVPRSLSVRFGKMLCANNLFTRLCTFCFPAWAKIKVWIFHFDTLKWKVLIFHLRLTFHFETQLKASNKEERKTPQKMEYSIPEKTKCLVQTQLNFFFSREGNKKGNFFSFILKNTIFFPVFHCWPQRNLVPLLSLPINDWIDSINWYLSGIWET